MDTGGFIRLNIIQIFKTRVVKICLNYAGLFGRKEMHEFLRESSNMQLATNASPYCLLGVTVT